MNWLLTEAKYIWLSYLKTNFYKYQLRHVQMQTVTYWPSEWSLHYEPIGINEIPNTRGRKIRTFFRYVQRKTHDAHHWAKSHSKQKDQRKTLLRIPIKQNKDSYMHDDRLKLGLDHTFKPSGKSSFFHNENDFTSGRSTRIFSSNP